MPGKLPETGFLYTDQQGTIYRFIGTSRHWQTMEELLIFQEEEEKTLYAPCEIATVAENASAIGFAVLSSVVF